MRIRNPAKYFCRLIVLKRTNSNFIAVLGSRIDKKSVSGILDKHPGYATLVGSLEIMYSLGLNGDEMVAVDVWLLPLLLLG
jgi:hypothetical protein